MGKWSDFNDKIIRDAAIKRIPVSGTFELTTRCNLRCKMCYVSQVINDEDVIERERSAKEWINLGEQARDTGMLYLLLTGGEVFIRPEFKEIYQEYSMMGLKISIYSNATMITPAVAKWLAKIPPYKISVTLYGSSPETYYKVTGFSDGYQKAVNGIDNLLAEGIRTGIRTTVVKGNEKEFYELVEFAGKRNINLGVVNYIGPRRDEGNTDPLGNRLSPKELVDYEINVVNYNKNKEKKVTSVEDLDNVEDNRNNNTASVETRKPVNAYRCNAGKCNFWISWDGKMYPCGVYDSPVTHPFDSGFKQAWENLVRLCDEVPVCEPCIECAYKNYCIKCPSRHAVETGYFDKPAPYLCETAKLRYQNKVFI